MEFHDALELLKELREKSKLLGWRIFHDSSGSLKVTHERNNVKVELNGLQEVYTFLVACEENGGYKKTET